MDPDAGRNLGGHLASPCHFIDGNTKALLNPDGIRMTVWKAQTKDERNGRGSKRSGLKTVSTHVYVRFWTCVYM